MGFNFGTEVARLSPPLENGSEHGLNLLRRENALDCCRQSVPLGGFFHQLFAAGRCQRIKALLAFIWGDSPLRENPAALLKPLERRIKGSVLHQEFFIRGLLDDSCDALPVLWSKDQRAQNQQVQSALQQFE